ncbi:MAG TPA: hypothetical protein VGW34_01115 [Allosphingosinicella sp.]|nr:hypothetical protein [Allosphingosinicella sp.]
MSLPRAAALGAIAALAIPWVMREETGQLGEWVQLGVVRFSAAGLHLLWSWPLFAVVTLFAWGLLAWANR